jgi:hypothetical protein
MYTYVLANPHPSVQIETFLVNKQMQMNSKGDVMSALNDRLLGCCTYFLMHAP